MKTFTASSLLVLATQLLSISANPVPAAEANNLVARACDCNAWRNAQAIGDTTAAGNAISSCKPIPTPFPSRLLTPLSSLCLQNPQSFLLTDKIRLLTLPRQ